jgi:hypothetical protein
MNATPIPSGKRPVSQPSQVNVLFSSLFFAILMAVASFFVFYSITLRTSYVVPSFITVLSFILSFIFTSIFQLVNQCPFNPTAIATSSGIVSTFVLFMIGLLSFSWTGQFLRGVVTSAFPYIPDPLDPRVEEDPAVYSQEEKHEYSRAYAYWMFWGAILPMYSFLGLLGTC